jgi:hypothetical protein
MAKIKTLDAATNTSRRLAERTVAARKTRAGRLTVMFQLCMRRMAGKAIKIPPEQVHRSSVGGKVERGVISRRRAGRLQAGRVVGGLFPATFHTGTCTASNRPFNFGQWMDGVAEAVGRLSCMNLVPKRKVPSRPLLPLHDRDCCRRRHSGKARAAALVVPA